MSTYQQADLFFPTHLMTPTSTPEVHRLKQLFGHGHTLCSLLVEYPHLKGTVVEQPSVIENQELLWANKMGVGDRCTYIPIDMFQQAPPADAYMIKWVSFTKLSIIDRKLIGETDG
jgi:hypothetical protein